MHFRTFRLASIRLFAVLLTALSFLAARPAFGDPPAEAPRDPFLEGDACIRSLIPQHARVKETTVTFDWIRMPHLTANRLIHSQLKHPSHGDQLHSAAVQLIAESKAARLDLNTLLIRSGQRSKIESYIETAHAMSFESAQPIVMKTPQGAEAGTGKFMPAIPSSFGWLQPGGRSIEVEANCSDDGALIDLNFAPQWDELLGWTNWSDESNQVLQPVNYSARVSAQLLVHSGHWQFAAMFTPPPAPEAGPAAWAALPADRVLLFVRAALPGVNVPAVPRNTGGVKTGVVVAEWIEAGTDDFMALLASHSASDGLALRKALDAKIDAGTATLIETAAVPCRGGQRSKVESLLQFHYPTGHHHAAVTNAMAVQNAADAKTFLEEARFNSAPPTPASFESKHLWTTLEVEVNIGEAGTLADLNLAPEFLKLNDIDDHGLPGFPVKQPRFQTLKCNVQALVIPRRPVLISTFDPPLPRGAASPDVRERKVLLFVRVIF